MLIVVFGCFLNRAPHFLEPNSSKKIENGTPKMPGPICHQIGKGPNLPGPVLPGPDRSGGSGWPN